MGPARPRPTPTIGHRRPRDVSRPPLPLPARPSPSPPRTGGARPVCAAGRCRRGGAGARLGSGTRALGPVRPKRRRLGCASRALRLGSWCPVPGRQVVRIGECFSGTKAGAPGAAPLARIASGKVKMESRQLQLSSQAQGRSARGGDTPPALRPQRRQPRSTVGRLREAAPAPQWA